MKRLVIFVGPVLGIRRGVVNCWEDWHSALHSVPTVVNIRGTQPATQ